MHLRNACPRPWLCLPPCQQSDVAGHLRSIAVGPTRGGHVPYIASVPMPYQCLVSRPPHRRPIWPGRPAISERICPRGYPSGPGETGLIPSIHRGKGVREGRVVVVRVKSPSGMEERQKDSVGFCTGGAGLVSPRYREAGHATQTNRP